MYWDEDAYSDSDPLDRGVTGDSHVVIKLATPAEIAIGFQLNCSAGEVAKQRALLSLSIRVETNECYLVLFEMGRYMPVYRTETSFLFLDSIPALIYIMSI
jgi:hypothetical protein